MLRRFAFILAALAAFVGPVLATDFLHPEQAFRPSARSLDGETLEIRFDIAPGYYLYRDKFRFALEPDFLQIGTPQIPKG